MEISLRTKSSNSKSAKAATNLADLSNGQVVKGVIKGVEKYGAFIRIQGTSISGLCHHSKIDTKPDSDWANSIKIGETVRAVIIDVQPSKNKIGFSMKSSDLDNAGGQDSDQDDSDDMTKRLQKLAQLDTSMDADSDDDLEITLGAEHSGEDSSESEDAQSASSDDSNHAGRPEATRRTSGNVFSTAGSLHVPAISWSGPSGAVHDSDSKDNQAQSESESELDDDEFGTTSKPSTRTPAHEAGILIVDRTGDLSTRIPTKASDFDRLLLGSPDSSEIWIQYMAHFLEMSDSQRARAIGQRALSTINYRQEDERLNIWIALLNLEMMHGTEESFQTTFSKALQTNDDKQVYIRTLQALDQIQFYAVSRRCPLGLPDLTKASARRISFGTVCKEV